MDFTDAAEVDAWVGKTFVAQPDSARSEDLFHNLEHPDSPTLHYLPGQSGVFLQASHWYSDSIGLMLVLNALFENFAQPNSAVPSPEEILSRLPMSLEEAAKHVLPELTADASVEKEELGKWLGEFGAGQGSLGLPLRGSDEADASTSQIRTLPTTTTQAIISASKERGFSVTTAVYAAVIQTTYESVEESERDKTYCTMQVFNLRKVIEGAGLPQTLGPVNYIVHIAVSTSEQKFDAIARQLGPFYKSKREGEPGRRILAASGAFWDTLDKIVWSGAGGGITMPKMFPPCLISLGVVDDYLKPVHRGLRTVQVDGFWLGLEALAPPLMIYVWTFAGKLSLAAFYNKKNYEHEFVSTILDRASTALMRGLDIAADVD